VRKVNFTFITKNTFGNRTTYIPENVSPDDILREKEYKKLRDTLVDLSIEGDPIAQDDLKYLMDFQSQRAIRRQVNKYMFNCSEDSIKAKVLSILVLFHDKKFSEIMNKIFKGETEKPFSYIYGAATNFTVDCFRKQKSWIEIFEADADNYSEDEYKDSIFDRRRGLPRKKGLDEYERMECIKLYKYLTEKIYAIIKNFTRTNRISQKVKTSLAVYISKKSDKPDKKPSARECVETIGLIQGKLITEKEFNLCLFRAREFVKKQIFDLEDEKDKNYRAEHKNIYTFKDFKGKEIMVKDRHIAAALKIFHEE